MQRQEKSQEREYTYKDYLTWPEKEHWEIIDGKAYPTYGITALAAPNRVHQNLVLELGSLLRNYLRGKTCEVYVSPFDVVFEESENTKTVVQPDLLVVCDVSKVREKNIIGAPDIAIEVLSPTTARKDWGEKWHLYEREGVKEYWIVSPEGRTINKYTLTDGRYRTEILEEGELTSGVLEGFSLDIKAFFSVLDERKPIIGSISDYNSAMEAAEQKGEKKKAVEVAKKALAKGYPIDDVAELSGLDTATIEGLIRA